MTRVTLGERMSIRAIYENGAFRPLEDVPVAEGTEVDVYPREGRREKSAGGIGSETPKASVMDDPAFGMWKDRDDIGDGVAYVNRMRASRK